LTIGRDGITAVGVDELVGIGGGVFVFVSMTGGRDGVAVPATTHADAANSSKLITSIFEQINTGRIIPPLENNDTARRLLPCGIR
jgi:hypothetical protein